MAKLSGITTPSLTYDEGAAPSTPAAGKVILYAKSDGLLYSKDDAGTETLVSGGAGGGSVATDAIWDAAGDLAVGSGANTAARLAIGSTNGMVVSRVSGAVAWALPPGHEFDYTEKTADVSVTNTTEGTADTVVTSGSVSFDGSTAIYIEFYCPRVSVAAVAGANIIILLYEDSTLLGRLAVLVNSSASGALDLPVMARRRRTPSNASHTYTIKATRGSDNGTLYFASGGTGDELPGYIRITKV